MTDVFLWANHIDSVKSSGLEIELFVFNKNYTPYTIRTAEALSAHLPTVFVHNLINEINLGAGTGLSVRDLEELDTTVNVLPRTPLEMVGRAETLIHLIEHQRHDIVEFSQNEHEFKRIKGIVACVTHRDDPGVKFYVVKLLKAGDSISTSTAWQINGGRFEPHDSEVSLKMPTDNQVLIINGNVFIFNQSKFTQLFEYDIQQILTSDKKGALLSQKYKLSLPDLFNDFAVMARSRKSTLKKLLDVNTEMLIDQEEVISIADNMQVELMIDDAGAIILFDSKDLGVFLDILNDNYLSSATGNHYLAKSKKALDVAE